MFLNIDKSVLTQRLLWFERLDKSKISLIWKNAWSCNPSYFPSIWMSLHMKQMFVLFSSSRWQKKNFILVIYSQTGSVWEDATPSLQACLIEQVEKIVLELYYDNVAIKSSKQAVRRPRGLKLQSFYEVCDNVKYLQGKHLPFCLFCFISQSPQCMSQAACLISNHLCKMGEEHD